VTQRTSHMAPAARRSKNAYGQRHSLDMGFHREAKVEFERAVGFWYEWADSMSDLGTLTGVLVGAEKERPA
jgi:hypothetical protein